jgi:hypothetical protein
LIEAESIDGVLAFQWARDSWLVSPVPAAGSYGFFAWRFPIPPGRDRTTLMSPRINRFGLGFHLLKTRGLPWGWRTGNRRLVIVYLPYWLLVILTASLPVRWVTGFVRSRPHNQTGFCAHCGYNLTGNTSGVCPECGRTITETRAARSLRVRRARLIAAAAFTAFVFSIVWRDARDEYHDYLVRRQLFAHQHRYLSYSPSPDLIAYDEDPAAQRRLLASSRNYVSIGKGACYLPDVLNGPLRIGFGNGPPILFMHGRRSPGGTDFLVVVSVMSLDDYEDIRAEVHGPVTEGEVSLPLSGTSQLVVRRWPPEHLTFLFGQSDPSDPSHFTIGYRLGEKTGTLEGWLADDATVKMQVRDGPAQMLSTSPKPLPLGMKWGGRRSAGTH